MNPVESADVDTPGHAIRAWLPRGEGHQFVVYSDACSGVAGAPHEATFASVNAIVSRLGPAPEFICFPGDEVIGLTADEEALRKQWEHWFNVEMSWLDRARTPLFHTTGNHTTYDAMSDRVFREVLSHLFQDAHPEADGLNYAVQRGDLLLVFIDTLTWSLGGEGHVETEWVERTLAEHSDARHKLVFGHHPVFSVNGFSGAYQRDIASADGATLWDCFVRHGVLAYVCSHILAYDVQVHEGVLQILTAGAGAAHRMPEETEYLHAIQAALDTGGLRYQVLDTAGTVKEWLDWPPLLPSSETWQSLALGTSPAPVSGVYPASGPARLAALQWCGIAASSGGEPQTLLAGWNDGPALPALWIGLTGLDNQLSVLIAPQEGRSPHLWHGPCLGRGERFEIQVLIHTGMGPGGIMWRLNDDAPWTSLTAASPWGAERLEWPDVWSVGHGKRGASDSPFRGEELRVRWHSSLADPPV